MTEGMTAATSGGGVPRPRAIVAGDVRIVFKHQHFDQPVWHARRNGKMALVVAQTEALLLQGDRDHEEVVAVGRSRCSVEDQGRYSREGARQLALKRAVQGLPRAQQGEILSAYFTRPFQRRGER